MATPAYGLDATLAAKAAAKYDPGLEKEVTTWISAVTGVAMEGTVGEWLHDGKVLCQLANAIKPGSVKKINTMNAPFKQRENITYFQKFMRDNGMNESSMFGTDDLYDEKNMGSFIIAMNTFGGVLQTHVPEFSGPKLGVAVESHVTDSKRNDHKGKDFAQGCLSSNLLCSVAIGKAVAAMTKGAGSDTLGEMSFFPLAPTARIQLANVNPFDVDTADFDQFEPIRGFDGTAHDLRDKYNITNDNIQASFEKNLMKILVGDNWLTATDYEKHAKKGKGHSKMPPGPYEPPRSRVPFLAAAASAPAAAVIADGAEGGEMVVETAAPEETAAPPTFPGGKDPMQHLLEVIHGNHSVSSQQQGKLMTQLGAVGSRLDKMEAKQTALRTEVDRMGSRMQMTNKIVTDHEGRLAALEAGHGMWSCARRMSASSSKLQSTCPSSSGEGGGPSGDQTEVRTGATAA